MGLHRYLANRFLTIVSNVIFNQNLTDMETAVKSFRSYLIKDLNLIANGFDIEPEFVKELSRLNVRIDEVSINYEPRSVKDGKKISFKDGFITWDISSIRGMIDRIAKYKNENNSTQK